tara:strand:- start:196 stop:387 length:192 start_codon:yes stop_codon:yes gene_type:complete
MIKEFEIRDILNAINSISKSNRKKSKILKKEYYKNKDKEEVLTLNNKVKSNKSEILVLDQMIE